MTKLWFKIYKFALLNISKPQETKYFDTPHLYTRGVVKGWQKILNPPFKH